ncbi:response regulator [Sphingomonas sp. BN140010]|uniref:Response regulator n=1 Tax=Sphingomonas arvum TaxID=2992113 RepID=A0ABT3JC86_9SPHN|nr:response regulator [Sphingomonas sp. BN140010]MCW3796688.1 response regulator [Sphingomonas sp. BN140010]
MRDIDHSCLTGRRILIVEDEALVAMNIEEALADAGATVLGIASTVRDALSMVAELAPDAVTLDGNLDGELSGPVARYLQELGIRHLVVTGYVDLALSDPHLASAPKLAKPFTAALLRQAAELHLCG